MSSLSVAPELVATASGNLQKFGSALRSATAAAASQTTAIAAPAADEVSAAITALFGAHAREFHALSAKAAAFNDEFASLVSGGAAQYVTTEIANAEQTLVNAVYTPAQALLGHPLIGTGQGTVVAAAANPTGLLGTVENSVVTAVQAGARAVAGKVYEWGTDVLKDGVLSVFGIDNSTEFTGGRTDSGGGGYQWTVSETVSLDQSNPVFRFLTGAGPNGPTVRVFSLGVTLGLNDITGFSGSVDVNTPLGPSGVTLALNDSTYFPRIEGGGNPFILGPHPLRELQALINPVAQNANNIVGTDLTDSLPTPQGIFTQLQTQLSNDVSNITGKIESLFGISPGGGAGGGTGGGTGGTTGGGTGGGTVVATISVGNQPQGVAVSPTGPEAGYVYVTNAGSGTVSVINPATNAVVATIPVGPDPTGIGVIPTGPKAGYVYVANSGTVGGGSTPPLGTVSVINPATNAVTATIDVTDYDPHVLALAVSPTGDVYVTGTAYVGPVQQLVGEAWVIDPATNTVTTTINLGPANPTSVAVNPTGPAAGYIYVEGLENGMGVINPATNTVTATIPDGGPAVSPTGPEAGDLFAAHANSVSVLDPVTYAVTGTIPVGADSLAVSPTGPDVGDIYMSVPGVGVQVANPATNAVIATIYTDINQYPDPGALAVSPTGPEAGYIYVTDYNTVQVIRPD